MNGGPRWPLSKLVEDVSLVFLNIYINSLRGNMLTVILLTLLILFASALTRSTFGFGDALIAMPLLTLLVGVQTATPLVAFVGPTIAFTIVWRNWRNRKAVPERDRALASRCEGLMQVYVLSSKREAADLADGILSAASGR